MKLFDLVNAPLCGTNLIEAGAGTGKTYAVAGLFLRLILEENLLPEQILVVTFTKAATQELKDRIRKCLVQAKRGFSEGSSPDPLIDALVRAHQAPTRAAGLLQAALVNFDRAGIFTIHGFCQRILNENAFETRTLFDTELETDTTPLTREIAHDFWRKQFYRMPPELIGFAVQKISGPDYFVKLLAKKQSPETIIIPDLKQPTLGALEVFRKAAVKVKTSWPLSKKAVSSLLKSPDLSGTVYGGTQKRTGPSGSTPRDLKILAMTDAMDRWVDAPSAAFPLFKDFEKFTAAKIGSATRKGRRVPTHELFDVCDALYREGVTLESEMQAYLVYLKTGFLRFASDELTSRHQASNSQFFDDLLMRVKNALTDRSGHSLAAAVRRKYRAILVDEFQDTDSVQYEIFSKLFSSETRALFFIGDPKQSIYGFRGADIFSYMKAARRADSKYTLIANWRSNPDLITAVNTIFSNVEAPFVFDRIPFEPGIPARRHETASPGRPFTLWHLFPADDGFAGKTEAIENIAATVSSEIARLTAEGAAKASSAEQKRFHPGDIAVLVRTNRQAKIIKKHLSDRQLPSVLFGEGNVFHTPEALELERVLAGIAEPANERLLRPALASDLMGMRGSALDTLAEASAEWESRVGAITQYSKIWRQSGFIHMFRLFMAREKVRQRLLELPNGERRITNVLHLAEILHQESLEKKRGVRGLVKWLSTQRKAELAGPEAYQLRLEGDENAVSIVTIHKSKGLEYPVVFCPYVWDGAEITDNEVAFHLDDENASLVLDLDAAGNPQHVRLAQNELLAENLRLIYVALTRAKKRCFLVWGRFRKSETSALAYLFHSRRSRREVFQNNDLILNLKTDVSIKNSKAMIEDLSRLESRSAGTIEILPMPHANGPEFRPAPPSLQALSAVEFSGKIDASWRISSFSHMVSQKPPDETFPDHDAVDAVKGRFFEAGAESFAQKDVFSFPGGTRSGILVHDIFEHLDFASNDKNHIPRLVSAKLEAHGFGRKWEDTVCSMIRNVLATELKADSHTFSLSSIPCKARINEMEFYFPLKPFTPQKLKQVFEKYRRSDLAAGFPERIGRLAFSVSKGFMKGYIDTVFFYNNRCYLVDWKSNLLGYHYEDYQKAALAHRMNRDYYMLQYHLYVLALDRYLTTRVPGYRYDTGFGGVFYIFVRGVSPERGAAHGIFYDFPDPDLVRDLGKAMVPQY